MKETDAYLIRGHANVTLNVQDPLVEEVLNNMSVCTLSRDPGPQSWLVFQ